MSWPVIWKVTRRDIDVSSEDMRWTREDMRWTRGDNVVSGGETRAINVCVIPNVE